MAHYLVVAHEIADRDDLLVCLQKLIADDRQAACTLLVTATHPLRGMTGHTPALEAAARERAAQALIRLQRDGVYLARAIVGDGSPGAAVEDELRRHPETYDAVVLCTTRPGLRSWFRGDLRTQLEARVSIPVFHVHADTIDPWRREQKPRMPLLSRWWALTRFTAPANERPVPSRRQMVPLLCLMAAYLTGGLVLAFSVNRGFLLNDAVALVIYTVVLGGLLVALRIES